MNKKTKKTVPELRFPEFTGDWEHSTIEKNASVSSGGTPSRTEPSYWNGDIPWVTTSEIGRKEIFDSIEKITKEGLENSSAKMFEKNTILLAMYGQGKTRGQVSILRIEATTNQACAAITLKKKYSPEFLYYFLFSQYDRLRELSNDGSQKNLSAGLIKQYRIPVTPLPEQEKIAKFLSLCDEKLNALRHKRECLETYKRGVMQQIFTQKIRFQDDDGSDFPDWDERTMGSLYKWITTNSLSRENLNYDSGTVKNIHYGDIHRKFKPLFILKNEEVPYVSDDSFVSNLDEEYFCQIGDLVIADASEDYADIGKAIEIIDVEPRELIAGLHCFIARPKKDNVAVGFSGYLFQTEKVQNQIRRIAQGISVLGISKTNLSKILLPYPSQKEQEKIAQFLTAIDRKIEAVSQQIERMEQFKKGLLQKMFV